MNIALIAHDKRKDTLVNFIKNNEQFFSEQTLFSTGTTGLRVMENTNLQITRFQSGPLGGDQEVGALVAKGQMDAIFFFRDPLTSQPHEPDVNALLRLCDVYHIPVATNTESANAILYYLKNHKK
ncbi:methylglyoxal synthase [Bacillus sp. RG28]|uniref:Methylglyoxal synthase n=1 Tax=Gottfriedia endophytica TaxID=2820819 RepID=A0A940NMJ6_9BACI|nr:methylglyoxal synthase [Gottfriedia endophytica]MBP0724193.1 methylglyoxal synthase [Gottfriedia endophytica]